MQIPHIDALATELPDNALSWGFPLQQQNLLSQALALPYRHTAQIVPGGPGVEIRGAFSVIGRAYDGADSQSFFGWEFDALVQPKVHQLRTSVLVEIVPSLNPSLNQRVDNDPVASEVLVPGGKQFHYRISDFASATGAQGTRQWWAHGVEFSQPIAVPAGFHALVWLTPVIKHEFGQRLPATVRAASFAPGTASGIRPIFPVIGGHAGTIGSPFLQLADAHLPFLNAAGAVWGELTEQERLANAAIIKAHFRNSRVWTTTSDRAIPTWVY